MSEKSERSTDEINAIIEQNLFRKDVYDLIPEGSRRILDFGCNRGELLLRLRRDKGCQEVFGVEILEEARAPLGKHLDGSWIMDLGKPDSHLGDAYLGFFNLIVMHDVLEHLYDPWYVLAKLRRYLAPEGQLILVVPNFRYWYFVCQILTGAFTYGDSTGFMNEGHIRWFTLHSLRETIALSGLKEVSSRFLFPADTDFEMLARRMQSPIDSLELPPPETGFSGGALRVSFPQSADIRAQYPQFLAFKILMVCSPDPAHEGTLEPIEAWGLSARRKKAVAS